MTIKKEKVLVVTPRLKSKFSPAIRISKTPVMKTRAKEFMKSEVSKELLGGFRKKEAKNIIVTNIIEEKEDEKIPAKKTKKTTSLRKNFIDNEENDLSKLKFLNINDLNDTKITDVKKHHTDAIPNTQVVAMEKTSRLSSRNPSLSSISMKSLSENESNSEEEIDEINMDGYFYVIDPGNKDI